MPAVPLGIGSYKLSHLPEVKLRNMYLEKDKSGLSPDGTLRICRPGLSPIRTYAAALRAVHYRTSEGQQLVVAGGSLYNGASSVGLIAGTGIVPMVSTPFASLMLGGFTAYLYDETLATLPTPENAPAPFTDVDQLNGYGLFLCENGRFYWLVPGEAELDLLNFATAESLPDRGVALRRLGDEFWVFGGENIEVWQATGEEEAPFQRAPGRNFERGCLYRDAVRRFDNTLVWIGDDFQVYRASSVPQVISDSGISQRIQNASGPCSAWTFGILGHSFYVLRVPGQGTFAYDAATQEWSEFVTDGKVVWEPYVGYQVNGQIVAGSSDSGALWLVDAAAATDAGGVIECVVTGTVPINGKPPRNDSVSIGVGVAGEGSVRLRWKDGQDDFPTYYDEIEVRAPFDVAQLWRLGQPDQPYRTFEISIRDPIQPRIAGMMANEGWA